ncbi:MAG: PAS domain S-box protein [Phenylobacterium sp.]|nr:MAG: PAS domain S-box protein [Phenylobacterium sp.]
MNDRFHHGQSDMAPFAGLAEALGLGMAYQIVVPPGGSSRRFTYLTANCEALTGVPAAAALADPTLLYDQILPEHRETFARAEAEALAGDGRFEIEVEMRRADGEVRWRRVASARRTAPDGSTLWDGLLTDITEARRTAAELEAQRSRLEVAVEATGLGFWEWNPRTNVLNWSERNKAVFGFPADAAVTMDAYMAAIHPDDVDRCREAYVQARERAGGGDFAMEYRAVMPNGQLRWILTQGRVLCDADGPAQVVGTTLDNTERHEAEERRSLVMGELAHRAKNGLQVMMAIVTETARSSETVKGFEGVLIARLNAMAQAQDLVTASGGRPVQVSDVAERALSPFGLARFEMQPQIAELTVRNDVASGLALLLHEMATNAVKYGALSRAEGRVSLLAEHAGPGMAALHWRERGGPVVEPSNRRGFGTRLLQAALRQHGGKVEPAFEPEGFSARMEFRVAG